MWVTNLVEPWRGDSNSIPVIEFFESINKAAKMGMLSSKDKIRGRSKGGCRAGYRVLKIHEFYEYYLTNMSRRRAKEGTSSNA
jgi:hypothetical protein